ncbi:uncharacterized protein [Ptychodera flava]|uniref:uncharacterized protein n=1 Tax=Ptychodera flava TaxID=63121 RepID=UPI003969D9FB
MGLGQRSSGHQPTQAYVTTVNNTQAGNNNTEVIVRNRMPGHRNCCVVGCGNSGVRLEKWMAEVCSSHNCLFGQGRCNCRPPFTLFPFPTGLKDESGRLRWQRLINRKDGSGKNWKPNRYSRVCSRHFIDGTPTKEHPDPTLYLGYTDTRRQIINSRRKPVNRIVVVKCDDSDGSSECASLPTSSDAPQHSAKISSITSSSPITTHNNDHDYCSSPCEPSTCINERCTEKLKAKDREIDLLRQYIGILKREVQNLKTKLNDKIKQPFSHLNLSDDRKTKLFTGLPNRKTFDSLFDKVLQSKASKLKYWRGPSKLSTKVHRFTRTQKKSGPSR